MDLDNIMDSVGVEIAEPRHFSKFCALSIGHPSSSMGLVHQVDEKMWLTAFGGVRRFSAPHDVSQF